MGNRRSKAERARERWAAPHVAQRKNNNEVCGPRRMERSNLFGPNGRESRSIQQCGTFALSKGSSEKKRKTSTNRSKKETKQQTKQQQTKQREGPPADWEKVQTNTVHNDSKIPRASRARQSKKKRECWHTCAQGSDENEPSDRDPWSN